MQETKQTILTEDKAGRPARYTIKDSVFTNLFKEKKYLL